MVEGPPLYILRNLIFVDYPDALEKYNKDFKRDPSAKDLPKRAEELNGILDKAQKLVPELRKELAKPEYSAAKGFGKEHNDLVGYARAVKEAVKARDKRRAKAVKAEGRIEVRKIRKGISRFDFEKARERWRKVRAAKQKHGLFPHAKKRTVKSIRP